jgi:hypothetical protein
LALLKKSARQLNTPVNLRSAFLVSNGQFSLDTNTSGASIGLAA